MVGGFSKGGSRIYYTEYDQEADETYDPEYDNHVYYANNELYGEHYEAQYQDPQGGDWSQWEHETYEAEGEWPDEQGDDETLLKLQEEEVEMEKNRKELEVLMAEADRNLVQARKAVAAAHRDRGWSGTVQQRQPRSTSTFPGKNKGKGFKSGFKNYPKGKGISYMDANWVPQGGKYGKKGKPFNKSKEYQKGPSPGYNLGMIDIDDEEVFGATSAVSAGGPSSSVSTSSEKPLAPHKSVLDTGATATAGGKQAVKDLCKALVTARPGLKLDIFEAARPWFRFGNGKWGRALYKVTLKDEISGSQISVYALPAVGVPVLTGMKELEGLGAILNCKTGHGILHSRPVVLERDPKRHLILDYLKHVFPSTSSGVSSFHDGTEPNAFSTTKSPSTNSSIRSSTTTPRVRFSVDSQREECHVLDIRPLEIEDFESFALEGDEVNRSEEVFEATDLGSHLGVTHDLLDHLLVQLPPKGGTFSSPTSSSPTTSQLGHGRQSQGGDSQGSARGGGGRSEVRGERKHPEARNNREVQDPMGQHSGSRSGFTRSSPGRHSMAMLRGALPSSRVEPVRQMDRMPLLRTTPPLHACNQCSGADNSYRSASECGAGLGEASSISSRPQRDQGPDGEGYDHHRGKGASTSSGSQVQGLQTIRPEEEEESRGRSKEPRGREGGVGRRVQRRELKSQVGGEGQGEGPGLWPLRSSSEEDGPLDEATRQKLAASTIEFNVGTAWSAMQDFAKPFLFWEICCRADSSLSTSCSRMGLQSERKTLETGYDIGDPKSIKRMKQEIAYRCPSKSWFSLVCTAVSAVQNLNMRSWEQVEKLRKKRQRCRKHLRGAIEVIWCQADASGGRAHFYFEWPKGAVAGWKLPEMVLFIKQFQEKFGKLFFTQIDGCMHGTYSPDKWPIQKPWIIMHNDPEFHDRCGITCDRSHQHRPGGMVGMGSKAVQETAYYPASMVQSITRLWRSQVQRAQISPKEIMQIVLTMESADEEILALKDVSKNEEVPADEKIPQNAYKPGTEEYNRAMALLHRLHRAAGHPNNRALARLCRDRGMPPWVIQMAVDLQCQACLETKKGNQLTLPVSVGTRASPWQIIGLDVFELYFPQLKTKARYLIMTCLTMRFTAVHLLWEGESHQVGTDAGQKLVHAFSESWLMHRPRPEWVLVDAQTSLSKGDFVRFCQSIGIGVAGVPGEAHWQHGATESMVKSVKSTMRKLRAEQPSMSPRLCGLLAAHAQNHVDRIKGYSPIQWAYGVEPGRWNMEHDPLEVNQDHDLSPAQFWQLQRGRQKAEEVHKKELAASRMTQLYNAAPRPTSAYQVGDWVCVWRNTSLRARKKQHYSEPRFIGPGRIALIEPAVLPEGKASVFWVLMGTALWRCAPEQLRPASEAEILTEMVRLGDKMSIPLSGLLQRLHSSVDVSKEPAFDPERDLLPEHPPPTGVSSQPEGEVAVSPEDWEQDREPSSRRHHRSRSPMRSEAVREQVRQWDQLKAINDARRLEGLAPLTQLPAASPNEPQDSWEYYEETGKLIRHHHQQRWSLFDPTGLPDCPVEERYIQPVRRTAWWDDAVDGVFTDNWKKDDGSMQVFSRPWHGRTEFQVRAEGRKRKAEHFDISGDPSEQDQQEMDYLTESNAVLEEPTVFEANAVTEANEVIKNDKLTADEKVETSEQLEERSHFVKEINQEEEDEVFLLNFITTEQALEGEICTVEFEVDNMINFVSDATSYVATKLQTATKEVDFKKLEPKHQELMLEAMAREVSEVLRSQTLRALKEHVPEEMMRERLIPMRWILTWKPLTEPEHPPKDGSPTVIREDGLAKAKARVVIIGYKHPDLARRDPRTGRPQLRTSSPTLSRLGRQMILQAAAFDQHALESADAKSAFLQADEGIETQRIYTYGVPEVAYALGLDKSQAMEVVGAFYGLTNAPRLFWKDCDTKIQKAGAEPHALDKCIWLVRNSSGKVCGRIASHVDDFIITGDQGDPDWKSFRQKFKEMYKWSPWQVGSFTFAGIELKQTKNFNIYMTQENFCNALRPVAILEEHSRSLHDALSPGELTQCRGLAMKAQWRAIQTAPQYCARIGMLSSSLTSPTVKHLKEANSIMKELRKTAEDDLILHAFNFDRKEKLHWKDLIGVHFGDAGQSNRPCGGSTGGYITGFAEPKILQGEEAHMSILDWRSWKLDRPAKGSNSAEGQAIYEAEDKGWRSRLFWSLINGERLTRSNADVLASQMESLLVMDSRGCYDSITMSESVMLGMANSRTGVEMLHVQKGTSESSRCYPTWVPGDINLADALTKHTYEAFRVFALYMSRKCWIVRFNQEFVSARKQQRLRRQQQLEDGKSLLPAMAMWPEEDPALLDSMDFGLKDLYPSRH